MFKGGAAGAQLQAILSSPNVTAALSLPVELATNVLQQHINQALQVTIGNDYRKIDNLDFSFCVNFSKHLEPNLGLTMSDAHK